MGSKNGKREERMTEDRRGELGGGDSEKKIRRLRCTILSTTSLYETLRFQMIFGSVDILTNGNYFRAFLMNHAYVEREGCELSAKGAHVRGIFLRQGCRSMCLGLRVDAIGSLCTLISEIPCLLMEVNSRGHQRNFW